MSAEERATAEAEVVAGARRPGPWGVGMTLVFGGVIFLAYSIVQGMALVPAMVAQGMAGRAGGEAGGVAGATVNGLTITGFALALATAVGCPVMLLSCGVFARARGGPSVAEYLAIRPVRVGRWVAWVIGMLVFVIGLSVFNDLVEHPVPEFVAESYRTAGYLPFFWASIGVCAPVAEEVFFRGFVYAGLQRSRLGHPGALGVTALVFMAVHGGQYGWFDLAQVGLVGVVLGVARWRTGSLLPPVAMHVAMNLGSLSLYALQSLSEK